MNGAFYNCSNLSNIEIYVSLSVIDSNALYNTGNVYLRNTSSDTLTNSSSYSNIYYYSEDEPIDGDIRFWHFDETNNSRNRSTILTVSGTLSGTKSINCKSGYNFVFTYKKDSSISSGNDEAKVYNVKIY